jgi:FkbM family methyltransferase
MAWREWMERGSDRIRHGLHRPRTGPYHRDKARLLLGLGHLRDRIRREPVPAVRHFLEHALANLPQSHAQICQDLFVDWALGGRRGGFYCEFGATDGVALSNTRYLERERGWRGILAEPARGWHDALARNRPGAIVDHRCVWVRSGETLDFQESTTRELSSIGRFTDADGHARKRGAGTRYTVTTVALNDLLAEHGAPAAFDYLSLDTEGSELQILQALDFARWRPRVITVEHNFMPARDGLHALLTGQGYRRVLPECSQFDDWYVAAGIALPGEA